LNFNEVVQKGTGKISIYSSNAVGSSTTTLEKEFDVTSLPLISSVGAGSIMMSSTSVPSTQRKVGYTYRLIVPSTAYTDAVGNAFTELTAHTNNNYKKLKEGSDCEDPVFLTASMGETASTGSSTTFPPSSGKIVMYFSENVQKQSSGSVKLVPSNGGGYCSTAGDGCLNVGSTCTTACGYGITDSSNVALSDVQLSTLSVSGSTVTATVPSLQTGKGYKLSIDRTAFADASGNSLTATLPDIATPGMVYTLKVGAALGSSTATDSTGPLHATASGPPVTVAGTFPTSGAEMMPPSTAIVITFDETVQAGTGAVSFGSSTEVAVSDCQFSTKFMRCKPSGDLAKNTAYDVQFTKSAVTDVAGNTMRDATIGSTNSKLTFTTVDLDYMPPLLAAASGVTYASTTTASVAANTVDYAKPYDPVNGATQVAKAHLFP
jgi:hypothetical protein